MNKPVSEAAGRGSRERAGAKPKLSPFGTLIITALTLALLAGGGAWYGHWASGAQVWAAADGGDHVSAAETRQRQLAFESQGPTALHPVEPAQTSAAVDGMGLTADGRRTLLKDLANAVRPDPLRLAWITLWDTDVEDGDVVRIDSEGYSRVVVLTKHGATFAVPVPPSGVITITGINDGDGGGITVGLASGAAKAVLPIMSTGQTLRLSVSMP